MNMLAYRPILSLSDLSHLEQAKALHDPSSADDAIWDGYVLPDNFEGEKSHLMVDISTMGLSGSCWDCEPSLIPTHYRVMTLVAREDYLSALELSKNLGTIKDWVWAHTVDPKSQEAIAFLNSVLIKSEFPRHNPHVSLAAHYFRARATRVLIYRMSLRRDSKWRWIESQALMAETAANQRWERERDIALDLIPS
jgi:hypothetical protein